MKFDETLKDWLARSVDLNGILAPGTSGIWPKLLRGRGFEIKQNTEYVSSDSLKAAVQTAGDFAGRRL
jgi:hypothetical protein